MSRPASKSKIIIVGGVQGTVIASRKIQDYGRIQIPAEIRQRLGLMDGDYAHWVEDAGRFYIIKRTRQE